MKTAISLDEKRNNINIVSKNTDTDMASTENIRGMASVVTGNQKEFEVPKMTVFEQLERELLISPDTVFLDYFGRTMTKREIREKIYTCAKAFYEKGIREEDVVSICMPNAPEGIIAFYGALAIGAIPQMLHPLLSEGELKNHMKKAKSKMIILFNECYCKIENFIEEKNASVVTVSAKDSMKTPLKMAFSVQDFFEKVVALRHVKLHPFYRKIEKAMNCISNKKIDMLLENEYRMEFFPSHNISLGKKLGYFVNAQFYNANYNQEYKRNKKFEKSNICLKKKKTIPKNNPKYMKWDSFMKYGMLFDKKLKLARYVDEKVMSLLYTGGTTGVQKAVQLAHRSYTSMPIQFADAAAKSGLEFKRGDQVLVIPPIFHGFGIGSSVHTAWCNGVSIKPMIKYDHKKFHKYFEGSRVTHITLVPTMLDKIMANPLITREHLKYIKGIIVGGDVLGKELVDRWKIYTEKMNLIIPLYVGYGLTETLAGITLTDKNVQDRNVGKVMIGNRIKVVDKDTREVLPKGKPGKLLVSGPTVMLGYMDPSDNDNVLYKDAEGTTWLDTGDIGYFDTNDDLRFLDRSKRMFLSNGYNIYPSQIEDVIARHNAVESCVVLGEDHPYKTSVPVAIVHLKPGTTNELKVKSELMELCRMNLVQYSIPQNIEFIDEFELTIYGKTNYTKMKENNDNKVKQLKLIS